jgi:hypothetical protein
MSVLKRSHNYVGSPYPGMGIGMFMLGTFFGAGLTTVAVGTLGAGAIFTAKKVIVDSINDVTKRATDGATSSPSVTTTETTTVKTQ